MNPIYKYDFTAPFNCIKEDELLNIVKENCKKYCFQHEKSEKTNYEHFQGRISLKKKMRISQLKELFAKEFHFSPTSGNCKSFDYCMKEETRIGNCYKDTDEIIYIPKQIRMITKLHPYQQTIVEACNDFDTRTINFVYCPHGNVGKSTLVGYLRAHRLARCLPPVNDYKDIMRMVCDMPTAKTYIIDMPRALKKDKLGGFYCGIEDLKNGYAWDDRYAFKEKIFDCPNIWIFSNLYPDLSLLSTDKWKLWTIDSNLILQAEQSPCNTDEE